MSYPAGIKEASCNEIPDIVKDFDEPIVKKCLACADGAWTFTGNVAKLTTCFKTNAAHGISFNIFVMLITAAVSMYFNFFL